jgi:hypothetical protein
LAASLQLQPLDAISLVMAGVCGVSGLTVGRVVGRLFRLRG